MKRHIYESMLRNIENKSVTIGIIGLGYVGLSNVDFYADNGYKVIGFDINNERVKKLNNKQSYIQDVSSNDIARFIDQELFFATTDTSNLKQCDVIIIDVPTPIREDRVPNIEHIVDAVDSVLKYAKEGQLIILESTTFPTTTEKYLVEKLESIGFNVGTDIFVAFSPERIDPGNKNNNRENTIKIIGGHTKLCSLLTAKLMGENTHIVENTVVAELAKLYENTFRFINIAFVNELSNICDALDVNVFSVIKAASTKDFGFMPFYPSYKIGGHCIPIDPYYLKWFVNEQSIGSSLIDTASSINDGMFNRTVHKLKEIVGNKPQPKIAVIGCSYKADVDDLRESGIFPLLNEIATLDYEVKVYDSYFANQQLANTNITVRSLNYDELKESDVVIITVGHNYIDKERLQSLDVDVFDLTGKIIKYPAPKRYII